MKRKFRMGMLAFLGCILMCFSGVHASENDVIANDASGIPDRELYRQILHEMGKSEHEVITKREAERKKGLWIPNGGVQDLTGIGYFCNLTSLKIEDQWHQGANAFTSLKPLEDLEHLKKLTIDRSWDLESLAGIEGLTQLKNLQVTRTGLKSLKGIEGLTQLKKLDLRQNELKSLAGIEGLTQLKELRLDYGRLTSLKGIESLTNLKYLDAPNNRLKSAKEIRYLKHLKQLDLNNNRLTEVEGIRYLKNLKGFDLSNNRLTDIDGIKGLEKVVAFGVTNNQIRRIPELRRGQYLMMDFKGNNLSEGELNAKLKAHLNNDRLTPQWLKDQIAFQNHYKVSLTVPRKLKKIPKNTRRIVGKMQRSGPYRGEVYVTVNDKETRARNGLVKVDAQGKIIPVRGKKNGSLNNSLVRVQPDGAFVIDKAMAKKEMGDGALVETLRHQLKGNKELFFEIYIYSEESRRLECAKSVLITEKADFDIGYEWSD